MPFTVNGIGTAVVPARGYVAWGDEYDSDALECFVVFYLPLVPLKAIHAYDWQGKQYRSHPIRWSPGLVAKGFAWRWLKLLYLVAAGATFFTGIELYQGLSRGGWEHRRAVAGWEALPVAVTLVLGAFLVRRLLDHLDRRDRDIRLMLGPRKQGSSDPGTWPQDMAEAFKSPQELHGTERYADAVDKLLADRMYSSAMWAARIEVARGDASLGEQATDRVLANYDVRAGLEKVRAEPASWGRYLADPPPEGGAEGAAAAS